MRQPFLETVRRFVLGRHLLGPGDSVVVACSGGPDSVALLSAMVELGRSLEWTMVVAHANHQLRGVSSEEDESFVRMLCSSLGVPVETARLALSGSAGWGNLEDRARLARYDFLARVAAKRGAAVATGHTRDDQAETFLMKLARGAGPCGLSGIFPLRTHRDPESGCQVRVVRPLLEVTRSEVLEYLESRDLGYRTDDTNRELSLDRNWVRHRLLPVMQRRLNPQLARTLSRTAELMQEVDELLELEATRALEDSVTQDTDGIRLKIGALESVHPALRRVMIRLLVKRASAEGLAGLSMRHVGLVAGLARRTSGRKVVLPGGLIVSREYEWLRFSASEPVGAFRYLLNVPGTLEVKEAGKRIAVEPPPGVEWSSDSPLVIRNRLPGDRIRLEPLRPPSRLKKAMGRLRIPRSERDRLLVVEHEGEVVFVERVTTPPGSVVRIGTKGTLRILVETFGGLRPSNR